MVKAQIISGLYRKELELELEYVSHFRFIIYLLSNYILRRNFPFRHLLNKYTKCQVVVGN